jgi:vacuolar protein sorting-associated protein 11
MDLARVMPSNVMYFLLNSRCVSSTDVYTFSGPKISITSFRNYLVIVSPPFFPSSASASATVRNYVARAPNPTAATQTDVSKVTIFDLENKFIAYSESAFTEGVREVICNEEHIYILGNDGKVSHFSFTLEYSIH